MGLLTSTGSAGSSGFSRYFQRLSKPLSFLLFVAGIGFFAANVWPSFTHDTYISEHALLVGVVTEHFDQGGYMIDKLRELEGIVQKSAGSKKDEIPYIWLKKEFLRARVEAYDQNFTARYPLGVSPEYAGRNVFGVVRAPRGASNEAIVIAAPYSRNTLPAVAVLLALAKFSVDQVYWSKDLIFVITEREETGMQAWLNGYHGKENTEFLTVDGMNMHSGPIQAALCLELTSVKDLTNAEISYNMINGQLPNLDLVNVAVRLASKHNIQPSIYGVRENYMSYSWEGYSRLLTTAASGILHQAMGPKSGLHQVFGQFNIEAVTVHPVTGVHGSNADIHSVATMIEGLLRSINNLLERFHQSFFFYVLLSPYRYMSIGIYMPAIAGMLLALLVKACALWVRVNSEQEEDEKEEEERKDEQEDSPKKKTEETKKEKVSDKTQKKKNFSVLGIAPYFIVAHVYGVLIRLIPDCCHVLLQKLGVPSVQNDYFLVVISVVVFYSLCFPIIMKKLYKTRGTAGAPSADLFRCLCLLEVALVLGVISVLNFGLGFILCLTWVPIFMIQSCGNKLIKPFTTLLTLLANPLVMLFLGHFIANMKDYHDFANWYDTAEMQVAAKKTMDCIMTMIVGSCLHGNWLFTIATVVLYPVWMLFWALVFF